MFLKFSSKRDKEIYNGKTESELISEYQRSGSILIPGLLFDPYVHLVYGVCMKYLHDADESKDAVMQIFEYVVKDLRTHKVENFKNWLYMVSKNYCLKIIRRYNQDKRYVGLTKNISTNFMDFDMEMSRLIDNTDENKYRYLFEELENLNVEQKTCIGLFYMEKKSYIDIVEITGYPLSKVKSYVQNGKRNLFVRLSKLDDFKDER